jgi:Glycine zipper
MAWQVPYNERVHHPNKGFAMRKTFIVGSIFAFAAAVGCSKTDTAPVDSALAIGATTIPIDSMSDLERAGMATAPALVAPAPVTQAPAAPRRTTSTRRSTASSGSASGSTASTPAQTTTIKKNTKRDAAIGAAAGAIIGATTSRDKVKGAVIGGVVGGVIGGVIGNNVDVQKKKK